MKPFTKMRNGIFNPPGNRKTRLQELQQLSLTRRLNSREHRKKRRNNKQVGGFKLFVGVNDCGLNNIAGASFPEAIYWLEERMRKEMMRLSRSTFLEEICTFTQIFMAPQVVVSELHKDLQSMKSHSNNCLLELLPIESSINSVMRELRTRNWKRQPHSLFAGAEHGMAVALMELSSQ